MIDLTPLFKIITPALLLSAIAYVVKGNRDFFKLIQEFHDKLPPKHKQAKSSVHNDIPFTVLDVSKMHTNLSTADIDTFHKRLENFPYNRIIIKRKEIVSFSKNLQRILNNTPDEKFKLAIIQKIFEDDSINSGVPYLFGYKIGKLIGF